MTSFKLDFRRIRVLHARSILIAKVVEGSVVMISRRHFVQGSAAIAIGTATGWHWRIRVPLGYSSTA
jgi:hypothetical protein